MIEQFTFFDQETDNSLEVVEVAYVDKRYTNVDELFKGFNHLYAITFSYGLKFIEKIAKYFDTVEVIVGCEAMVKFDLKTIMAFQTKSLEMISKRKYLIERVEDGTLSFWIAKELFSAVHEKLYILSADDRRTRIIFGSPNFGSKAFSGDQREGIHCFENDSNAFDYYCHEFENIKALSTMEVTKDALYFDKIDEVEHIESLPIAKELKTNNAGIILDNNDIDDEATEFVFDVSKLSAKYAKLLPKLNDKNGKTIVTSNHYKEFIKKCRQQQKEKEVRQILNPQFRIDYDNKTATFNNEPFSFSNIDIKIVKQDLIHLDEYFSTFHDFIGDTISLTENYFKLLNYIFLSPFIARLRYEALVNGFSTTSFPLYAIITGPKNAGKSFFVKVVQSIMFGNELTSVDPNNFVKTKITALLHECTGVPIHIEDIEKRRFTDNAPEIIKYEEGIIKEKLINHPVFILTSNNIENVNNDISKRMCYFLVDATLTNTDSILKHKKVSEVTKQISTSLYKEYFNRMLQKVDALINQIEVYKVNNTKEGWAPDIFTISSETIIEIYKDCGLNVPTYVSKVSHDDYIGKKSNITVNIIKKMNFEWQHNRKAFKILKKQNLLEYTAGERAYQAEAIKSSLPEILMAKTSGNKVIMELDKAEEVFGIHFKKGIF